MAAMWNRVKRVLSPPPDEGDGPKFRLNPGDTDRMWAAPEWLKRAGMMSWYVIGIVIAVLGVLALLAATRVVVVPFIVAVILAILFDPAVSLLARHGWSRGLAASVTVLVILATGLAIMAFTIWSLVRSLPALQAQFSALAKQVSTWLQGLGINAADATQAGTTTNQALKSATSFALSGLTSVLALVVGAFLMLFILLFLLIDYQSMKERVAVLFPVPRTIGDAIVDDFTTSTVGYFRALTVIGAINGIVMAVAALILGVPLAGAIGVITLITSYIPFFGAFIAGGVAAVIAFGSQGWQAALILVVISILYNNVASNVIQPIAAGRTLNLHPLVILLSTTVGGILFGLIGAILAAPIASAVATIRKDFREAREASAEEEAAVTAAVDASS